MPHSMEKSKVLALLQSSLESYASFDGLVKISEASKFISKSLALSQTYQLATDYDILKLLIYSIPINPNNTLFLLETILVKHQSNIEIVQNCWGIFQFIANIEDGEKILSLHKKFLEQTINNVKKTIKILEFEEEYLLKNIVELKKQILKLLPSLFQLVQKNFPETMTDKVFVLKLLKANSKNQLIISESAHILEEIISKHCPQLQNTERHPIINKTKKHTIKKIQPQNKSAAEKSILEQSVASNSPDIYSLLKSQTRTETFLTYIVCPRQIEADQRIWSAFQTGLDIKSAEQVRKQVSIRLLLDKNFAKHMDSHFSDLLVMFFNLIQRFFKQTDIDSIILILKSFLEQSPITVSVMIMQTAFLQKIFYNLEIESVYNFVYMFTTLKYRWIRSYKDIFYEYFKLSGFFQLILSNMISKKMQYLNPLKAKEFTQIESKLESRSVQLKLNSSIKRQTLDLDLSGLQQIQGEYSYQQPTQNNFQALLFTRTKTNSPSAISTPSQKKKSTHMRVLGTRDSLHQKKPQQAPSIILPPFAVKQYRGYFSTAPVLNFNVVERTEIIDPNEHWCYTNTKLYYEILQNLVSENNMSLLDIALPSKQQLQQLFHMLRKYKSSGLNYQQSNSCIEASKIIVLILRNENIRSRYSSIPFYCQKNINSMYPIIHLLFRKQKQPTKIQKLTVYKTLDTHTISMIELFLLLLRTVDKDRKQAILDDVDETLWQILFLLFFDCMIHNIYQTTVYEIFTELFEHGSQILLLNILFKGNLVGSLYNAYSDIVKNGVIITEWHIHSFFVYIYKIYALIKSTQENRSDIPQVSSSLSKMLSWTLLEAKIKQTFKKDADQLVQFII